MKFRVVALSATIGVLSLLFISYQNFDRVPGIKRIVEMPFGLTNDNVVLPDWDKMDPAMIELGSLLFFDKRMSQNNTTSCSSCHQPAKGYASVGRDKGFNGEFAERDTPTALNRIYGSQHGWIGDKTLVEQSTAPFFHPKEMGLTESELLSRIKDIPNYVQRFDRLAGEGLISRPALTIDNIGRVIASFQRSLMSGDSREDRFAAGDDNALTPQEIRGRNLFNGQARCILCHNGPNFSNEGFHNILSGCPPPPGNCSFPSGDELGRFSITGLKSDIGRFKTPSLRNVALRPPFFHEGHDKDLRTVVNGYNNAGDLDNIIQQDPLLVNLGLSEPQEEDLVAYLKALTGTLPIPKGLLSQSHNGVLREDYLLSPDVFEIDFYKNKYDLAGKTDYQVRRDWLDNGIRLGRTAHPAFDVTEYIRMYGGAKSAYVRDGYKGAILFYLDRGRRYNHVGKIALMGNFFNYSWYRKVRSNIKYKVRKDVYDFYARTGYPNKHRGHAKASGYYRLSNNVYYFQAKDGRRCRFRNKAEFDDHLGRSDDWRVGYFNAHPKHPQKRWVGMCMDTLF